jgi:hypothetical protein
MAESLTRFDWGEASHREKFYGRVDELAAIQQWIADDHCHLVVMLGKGGIGKTSLAKAIVEAVKGQFDYIFWRSLRLAPLLKTVLQDGVHFLSDQTQGELPESEEAQASLLIKYLQQHRCLLIFDSLESIMRTGNRAGSYQEGYENYGFLFERLGEAEHQSSFLLTSREQPGEIARLEGEPLLCVHIDSPVWLSKTAMLCSKIKASTVMKRCRMPLWIAMRVIPLHSSSSHNSSENALMATSPTSLLMDHFFRLNSITSLNNNLIGYLPWSGMFSTGLQLSANQSRSRNCKRISFTSARKDYCWSRCDHCGAGI